MGKIIIKIEEITDTGAGLLFGILGIIIIPALPFFGLLSIETYGTIYLYGLLRSYFFWIIVFFALMVTIIANATDFADRKSVLIGEGILETICFSIIGCIAYSREGTWKDIVQTDWIIAPVSAFIGIVEISAIAAMLVSCLIELLAYLMYSIFHGIVIDTIEKQKMKQTSMAMKNEDYILYWKCPCCGNLVEESKNGCPCGTWNSGHAQKSFLRKKKTT